jgi:hypothetical protein
VIIPARARFRRPTRTLVPELNRHPTSRREDAMAELDRTVWTAPVRNLVWVAAHFGHR